MSDERNKHYESRLVNHKINDVQTSSLKRTDCIDAHHEGLDILSAVAGKLCVHDDNNDSCSPRLCLEVYERDAVDGRILKTDETRFSENYSKYDMLANTSYQSIKNNNFSLPQDRKRSIISSPFTFSDNDVMNSYALSHMMMFNQYMSQSTKNSDYAMYSYPSYISDSFKRQRVDISPLTRHDAPSYPSVGSFHKFQSSETNNKGLDTKLLHNRNQLSTSVAVNSIDKKPTSRPTADHQNDKVPRSHGTRPMISIDKMPEFNLRTVKNDILMKLELAVLLLHEKKKRELTEH